MLPAMSNMNKADLQRFAVYWRAEGYKETTLREYLRHLNLYFDRHPDLDLPTVRDYADGVRARSASQGRYAVRALKAFDKYLAEKYERPPVLKNLKMPKDPTASPHRTVVAQPDDVAKILEACEKARKDGDHLATRDHAIISVLAGTGMRRSELARMEWRDVDFEKRTITIPETKNGEVRTVPLRQDVLDSLMRHARDLPSEVVWWTPKGTPLTSDSISGVIERRAKQAGVKITTHCFRRGMAVDFLRKGGSETYLRTIAGWNTPSMVQRYTKLVQAEEAIAQYQRLYG